MRLLSHAYSKYLRLIGGPNQSHKVNLKELFPPRERFPLKQPAFYPSMLFPSKTDICWEGTVALLVVASFVPPIVRGTLEEGSATMETWALESSPFLFSFHHVRLSPVTNWLQRFFLEVLPKNVFPAIRSQLRGPSPGWSRPRCIYTTDTLPEACRSIPDTSIRARASAELLAGHGPSSAVSASAPGAAATWTGHFMETRRGRRVSKTQRAPRGVLLARNAA